MSIPKAVALASVCLAVSLGLHGCGGGDENPTTTTTTVAPDGPGGHEKVKVRFWGESGCPYCSRFITESLAQAKDIAEIMDFDMWSFGNAYYITDACGGKNDSYNWTHNPSYSKDVRSCFNQKCGRGQGDPVKCYKDGPYCQHGEAECVVNRLQMCGKKVAFDNNKSTFMDYLPFVVCMQNQYYNVNASMPGKDLIPDQHVIESVVSSCASASVPSKQVLHCFNTNESSYYEARMAEATIPHDGVPLVQVTKKDGKPENLKLDDLEKITENTLTKTVCDAWAFNGGNRSIVPACRPTAGNATTTSSPSTHNTIMAV